MVMMASVTMVSVMMDTHRMPGATVMRMLTTAVTQTLTSNLILQPSLVMRSEALVQAADTVLNLDGQRASKTSSHAGRHLKTAFPTSRRPGGRHEADKRHANLRRQRRCPQIS